MIGQPRHMIKYSLRTLEKDGIVNPSPRFAIVMDRLHKGLVTLESKMDEMEITV